jgi:hypothetical protein
MKGVTMNHSEIEEEKYYEDAFWGLDIKGAHLQFDKVPGISGDDKAFVSELFVNSECANAVACSHRGAEAKMRAVSIANWFQHTFPKTLNSLAIPNTNNEGKTIRNYPGLVYRKNKKILHHPFEGATPIIDGSRGLNAVEKIIEACGLKLLKYQGPEDRLPDMYMLVESYGTWKQRQNAALTSALQNDLDQLERYYCERDDLDQDAHSANQ